MDNVSLFVQHILKSSAVIGWAQVVVVGLTIIFLIKYTKETTRLRKVAERQYAASFYPYIVLHYPHRVSPQYPIVLALENIGYGPGLKVGISNVNIGSFTAKFVTIPVINKGETKPISIVFYQNNAIVHLTPLGLAFSTILGITSNDSIFIPVETFYDDMINNHHTLPGKIIIGSDGATFGDGTNIMGEATFI
jgi:hypothetical protein